jgi:RNA polymerase sigma-70 factor, ECF subfamily
VTNDALPAFLDALRPHYADALRYCRALAAGTSAADAEDVLQQALLDALRGYDALRDPAKFRSWLFRIITREHHAQRRRSFWRRFVPLDLLEPRDAALLVYSDAQWSGDQHRLMAALARLGERDRGALLLEIAGFSLDEIRVIQGDRSLSAVKSRVSRARMRLRGLIEGEAPIGTAPGRIEEAALAAVDEQERRHADGR